MISRECDSAFTIPPHRHTSTPHLGDVSLCNWERDGLLHPEEPVDGLGGGAARVTELGLAMVESRLNYHRGLLRQGTDWEVRYLRYLEPEGGRDRGRDRGRVGGREGGREGEREREWKDYYSSTQSITNMLSLFTWY